MTEAVKAPARRRLLRRAALTGAVTVVAGVAVVGTLGLGGADEAPVRQAATTGATTAVEQRTLTRSVSIDGTIDYGAPAPLIIKATGTVTWLPPVGTVIDRGDPVLRVDDRPVVLLYGKLPQYRTMAAPPKPEPLPVEAPADSAPVKPGAPSPKVKPAKGKKPAPPPPFTGNDVEQFERNLRSLGYSGFEVDDNFTDATTRAVKKWQRDLGVPRTGTVELGSVVYTPGPVRIAKFDGRVGTAMSDDLVSISGNTRAVTMEVPSTESDWAQKGTAVSVELDTGPKVPGEVASVGAAGAAGDSPTDAAGAGADTVPVRVSVKDQKAFGGRTGGAATVTYVSEQRKNVLCVPVPALVALAEGGYGLERADGSGFVAVTTGMFADGVVEVSGPAVQVGLTVRVPA